MTSWLLIVAYHAGGPITMLDGGSWKSLDACLSEARRVQADKVSKGYTASSVCKEVKGVKR